MRRILLVLALTLGAVATGAADYAEAVRAHERGDFETAARQLRELAEAGDAKAQIRLGLMYREGRGVTRDATAAFAWLLRAAQQGRQDAQYMVGTMYQRGDGTTRNDGKAISWLHTAAKQGNRKAEAALEEMSRQAGLSANEDQLPSGPVEPIEEVPGRMPAAADPVRTAETDAVLAAMDPPASNAEAAAISKAEAHGISVRYGSLSPDEQEKSANETPLTRALRPSSTPASIQEMVGRRADVPTGPVMAAADPDAEDTTATETTARADGKADRAAAASLDELQVEAERGNAQAQRQLGARYHSGKGAPQDVVKAAQWYRKAALQGDAEAQFVLSEMYLKGDGVPKDRGVAQEWLKRAAARGHIGARARLAESGG